MKKKKGTRGAISVFLALILVPCIVFSSVFVDLSRVFLSKSIAESSSDLALNTLLTNYDSDLNDWYGMIASCQDIDQFYDVSAEFFLRTISSQDLSKDEIILLSDYYASATNDDSIYDLLAVEVAPDTKVDVKAVENANLSNATLLKDQIVEFMKYRAPLQLAEELLGSFLNADGSANPEVNAVLQAEENEDLVEDKQEFFEAEGELMKAAYYSYIAIYNYDALAFSNQYNNDKLVAYQNEINGFKTDYAYIHNAVVKYLLNTSGLKTFKRYTISLSAYNASYSEKSKSVYSRKVKEGDTTVYYIDGGKINSLLDDLDTKIDDFVTEKNRIVNDATIKNLMSKLPGNADWESNPVQWWRQAKNRMDSLYPNFRTDAQRMLTAYSKVLAIKKCTLGNDIPADWETRFDDLTAEVEALHKKYLKATSSATNDSYVKLVSKLEKVSSDNAGRTSASSIYVTVGGQSMTVSSAIPYIAKRLTEIKTELELLEEKLDVAIDGKGKTKSLDKLKELASTYSSTFKDWSDTADDKDTDLARDDREEIAIMTLEANINAASVNELKTRLKNIRSQLQTLINAINNMKYGGKKVIEIKDVSTFISKAKTKVSANSIPLSNKDIDNYAGTTFGQLFTPTSKPVTLSNTTGNSHNPDINPVDHIPVDTPDLYVHFYNKFGELDEKEVDKFKKAEKDEADTQTRKDEHVEAQKKQAGKYRGEGSSIAKEFSGGNAYNAGTALLSSVCTLFKDLTGGKLTQIRDDLYVTSYITSMFSYATYDREAQYQLLKAKDSSKLKDITPSNQDTIYSTVQGDANTKETWLSTDPTDSYNKTLTNVMINQANNKAYLAEVEYILYGGTNEENVKKAFDTIYVFRFGLNTISAFQHFWTPSADNPTANTIQIIASGISGFFCGVVPPAVIKAVMLPILAAMESCVDNNRLASGMPVELYKIEKDDWWLSVPAPDGENAVETYSAFFDMLLGDGTVDLFAGKNQDEGLFYSDYLTFFVYTGLCGGGDVEDDMYQRIAEVIQTNIRGKITQQPKHGGAYSLQKSIVYFEINATLRTKPLMITLPIFNGYENELDTKTDWCTYPIRTVRGYT